MYSRPASAPQQQPSPRFKRYLTKSPTISSTTNNSNIMNQPQKDIRHYHVFEAIKKRNATLLKKALDQFIKTSISTSAAEDPQMIQPYHYDAVPTDAVGRSPLYRAVESGILDLVKVLLEFYERKYDEFDRFNPKPKTISSGGSGSSASHQQLTSSLNNNSNKGGSSTTMSSSSTLFARSTNFFAARRSFSLLQAFPSTESLQVSLPESPSPAPPKRTAGGITTLLAANKFLSKTSSTTRAISAVQGQVHKEAKHAVESQLNEAFLVACGHGSLDLVMLLLQHGANPNGTAKFCDDQDEDDENKKKNKIPSFSFCENPSQKKSSHRKPSPVRIFSAVSFDTSIKHQIEKARNHHALRENENQESAKKSSSSSFGDDFGLLPIHSVAAQGFVRCVTLMIRKGVKLDAPDSNGMTALHHAAANGHDRVFLVLTVNGANVNARDHAGISVLHTAVLRNQAGIVKMILREASKKTPIEINTVACGEKMKTALPDGKVMLLKSTPLIDAIRLGYKRIVRLLLDCSNCDPCFSPYQHDDDADKEIAVADDHHHKFLVAVNRPLRFAVLHGNSKAVLRLIQKMKKEFDQRVQDLLLCHNSSKLLNNSLSFSASSSFAMMNGVDFLEYDPLNEVDEEGETVLFSAIRLGYNKIIRRLCRGEKFQAPSSKDDDEIKVDGETDDKNDKSENDEKNSLQDDENEIQEENGEEEEEYFDEEEEDEERPASSSLNDTTKSELLRRKLPQFKYASVTIKSNVGTNPLELAIEREMSGQLGHRMVMFLQRRIPPKPKKEGDDDANTTQNDDDDDNNDEGDDLSMSDSMFIKEWNEKQRQEMLKKMKQDEDLILKAERRAAAGLSSVPTSKASSPLASPFQGTLSIGNISTPFRSPQQQQQQKLIEEEAIRILDEEEEEEMSSEDGSEVGIIPTTPIGK